MSAEFLVSSAKRSDYDKKQSQRQWAKNLFNFLAPLVVLFLYTAIMAGIFYAVEKDCKSVLHCSVTTIKVSTIVDPPRISRWGESPTIYDWSETTEQQTTLANTILTYDQPSTHKEYNVAKNVTEKAPWSHLTYVVAFYFVLISITTIGYGDIYPCSSFGEILTIIFTLVGIPITLVALTRTAKTFARGLHNVWLIVYQKVKRPPYSNKQIRKMNNAGYLPLMWGIVVTVVWMLLSSTYFYFTLFNDYNPDPNTPPFTFFLAFYFTMISFLTIGFGDYAPIKYDMIFVTMIFLIVGLALVTMCIDLGQMEFDMFFDDVVDMIEEQYKETLADEDKQMHSDHDAGITHIINENATFSEKIMKFLLGKITHEHLAIAHEERAKLNSTKVHAFSILEDQQIQVVFDEHLADFSCQIDFEEDEEDEVEEERLGYNIESTANGKLHELNVIPETEIVSLHATIQPTNNE